MLARGRLNFLENYQLKGRKKVINVFKTDSKTEKQASLSMVRKILHLNVLVDIYKVYNRGNYFLFVWHADLKMMILSHFYLRHWLCDALLGNCFDPLSLQRN